MAGGIRPALQQDVYNTRVSGPAGPVQGRPSIIVPRVRIGAVLDQEADDIL